MRSLDLIEQDELRRDLPPFRVGDQVAVHTKIREGEKERIQIFSGVVISVKGSGIGRNFTVRRIVHAEGVERVAGCAPVDRAAARCGRRSHRSASTRRGRLR